MYITSRKVTIIIIITIMKKHIQDNACYVCMRLASKHYNRQFTVLFINNQLNRYTVQSFTFVPVQLPNVCGYFFSLSQTFIFEFENFARQFYGSIRSADSTQTSLFCCVTSSDNSENGSSNSCGDKAFAEGN